MEEIEVKKLFLLGTALILASCNSEDNAPVDEEVDASVEAVDETESENIEVNENPKPGDPVVLFNEESDEGSMAIFSTDHNGQLVHADLIEALDHNSMTVDYGEGEVEARFAHIADVSHSEEFSERGRLRMTGFNEDTESEVIFAAELLGEDSDGTPVMTLWYQQPDTTKWDLVVVQGILYGDMALSKEDTDSAFLDKMIMMENEAKTDTHLESIHDSGILNDVELNLLN